MPDRGSVSVNKTFNCGSCRTSLFMHETRPNRLGLPCTLYVALICQGSLLEMSHTRLLPNRCSTQGSLPIKYRDGIKSSATCLACDGSLEVQGTDGQVA